MRFIVSFALSIAFSPVVLADSTPFNCELLATDVLSTCARLEAMTVQGNARSRGRPVPTRAVIRLPAHGTKKAKDWGFACISGAAMRRLPNGWEQMRTRDHQHIRCEDI
ncbi:MAG: hypothetical protein V4673_06995 [Pseudomonadota bacterium]